MKKTISLFLAAFLLTASVHSQNAYVRCNTMEHLADLKLQDPGLAQRMQAIETQTNQWINNSSNKTQAVITIPVVVHVVYNTSAQNLTDAKVQAQISQLNLDYARANTDASNTPSAFTGVAANTQVQFCLAQRDPNGNPTTGIIHKSTTITSFSSNDNVKRNANGGDDAWPAGSYLNLWTCNLGGGLLGYAQFPGGPASTDGVVVLYSSVGSMLSPGTAVPYQYGRSATHEVGHWLNLIHIWGDANCGNDQVTDTPTQSTSNFGCPSFPHLTCSNGPNGDMFMNYMDYTDDGCMNMFSAGQTSRMQATLAGTRASLQTSLGCTPPTGGSCGTPSGLSATSITTTTATLNWTAISGATSYNIQYQIVGGSVNTTTSTSNSKALTGLTASSNYQFQVQAVCASGSSTYSSAGTFTTSGTGGGTCSNNNEPNNSRTAAITIATNTDIVSMIGSAGDNDYYKFVTTSPNTNVQVTLTNLPFDYDLRLYNSAGTTLSSSTNGGTTSELVKRNTTSAATYYVRVWGYNNAFSTSQCYTLRVNTSSTAFRTEQNQLSVEKGILLSPNPVADRMNVAFDAAADGKGTVSVMDLLGKTVSVSSNDFGEGVNTFDLNTSHLNNGVYFIQIINGDQKSLTKFVVNK